MSKPVILYYAGLFLLALGISIAIGYIAPGLIILGIGVIIQSVVCGLQSL